MSRNVPVIFTERTAETETWTMHRSIPIVGTDLLMKFELNGQYTDDNMQTLQTARLAGAQSTSSTYINYSTSNSIKFVAHRNLLTDPSFVMEGGSRADRKVALSSSLLSVIPETTVLQTVLPTSSAPITTPPVTATSVVKTAAQNTRNKTTNISSPTDKDCWRCGWYSS